MNTVDTLFNQVLSVVKHHLLSTEDTSLRFCALGYVHKRAHGGCIIIGILTLLHYFK